MSVRAPHFLLFAHAGQPAGRADSNVGSWRFTLRQPGSDNAIEAADDEPLGSAERLELLAIVRGLEALDQPSRVTLMTGSRQIRRGLEHGLAHWRASNWQWERYGQMTAVKNSDLWQRLDRLLEIHAVQCRPLPLQKADDLVPPPRTASTSQISARNGSGGKIRIDGPAASSLPRGAWERNPSRSAARAASGRRASVALRPTQSVGRRLFSLLSTAWQRGRCAAPSSAQTLQYSPAN